MTTYYCSG